MFLSLIRFTRTFWQLGKWHGIVVSMMAWGLDDPGSIPRLAKVSKDVIFILGVFMIQYNKYVRIPRYVFTIQQKKFHLNRF